MTEQEAINQIKADCHTGDYEVNGCSLDRIVDRFLRSNGYAALADAIDDVPCWRA